MFNLVILLLPLGFVLGIPIEKYSPPLDGRIIGGRDADVADYPYQISLLNGGHQYCGGAIISSEWVITAAHCVIDDDGDFLIRAGTSKAESGGEAFEIAQIIAHPEYNDTTVDYDIALLRLTSEISTANASAVSLPNLDVNGTVIPEGATAIVTGYGDIDENYDSPEVLQVVEIPVISQEECRKAYGESNVTDRMFCAGLLETGGKDSCFGDSGGPVVIDGILSGLVSWGIGCAEPNNPGVYTNVLALRSWINEISGL